MGDFNLDLKTKGTHRYQYRKYFEDIDTKQGDFNLVQLVNFITRLRMVNGTVKEFDIDQIYCNNPTKIGIYITLLRC
jgi:hypothetical protein